MSKATTKRHKCKVCDRTHTDALPFFPARQYTYRNENGNVYIDAYSVFMMFKNLGLDKHAVEFMTSVAGVRKVKEE
jgi:hypothetical protein